MANAADWARKWHLDVDWVRIWATYAITRWEYALSCPKNSGKGRDECRLALEDSDLAALQLVLSQAHMVWFVRDSEPAEGRVDCSVTFFGESAKLVINGERAEMDGPAPNEETKEAFIERAGVAYDLAAESLALSGRSSPKPRNLEQHSEWLVRSYVKGEKALDILGHRKGDPSTVHKAVKSLAEVVGLPPKVSARRGVTRRRH